MPRTTLTSTLVFEVFATASDDGGLTLSAEDTGDGAFGEPPSPVLWGLLPDDLVPPKKEWTALAAQPPGALEVGGRSERLQRARRFVGKKKKAGAPKSASVGLSVAWSNLRNTSYHEHTRKKHLRNGELSSHNTITI